MTHPELLGKCFGNIWILHDKRKFDELEKTALLMVSSLGYPNKTSKAIALHIRNAYEIHGTTDDKFFQKSSSKHNAKQINKYKAQIATEMNVAFKLAGFKEHKKLSECHSNWWLDFSYTHISKNKLWYIAIIWHIFILHLKKFKKIIPALKATYWLCLAGIYGHNERDNKILCDKLTDYWKILLASDSKPFMF